jgi:hypothetical protein
MNGVIIRFVIQKNIFKTIPLLGEMLVQDLHEQLRAPYFIELNAVVTTQKIVSSFFTRLYLQLSFFNPAPVTN